MNRRRAIYIFAILAAIAILYPLIRHMYSSGFDRNVWLAHRNDQFNNPRLDMVDDLVHRRLKRGMPAAAVVDLLGPPDGKETYLAPFEDELSKEDEMKTQVVYVYQLGVPWIDPAALCVALDASDHVLTSWQFGH